MRCQSVECRANIPPLCKYTPPCQEISDSPDPRFWIFWGPAAFGGQKILHFWCTIRSIYKGKSTQFERHIAKIFLPAAQNDLILTMTQIAPKARRKIRILWLYLRCKSRRRREENFGISGLYSNGKLSKICKNPGYFGTLQIYPPLSNIRRGAKGGGIFARHSTDLKLIFRTVL